ncbi:MAG: SUMF1/EgtB/PvdO family nonheme iron enzyme, partial [Planctomycetaceae bacterium]|nr:SUMF1/EgtB/PvdO family nonheme iron enzyme [Planctomycetaceae bacterium]
VILTKPFFMGVTEVTQAQYHDIMGEDPSYYSKKGKHSALVNGLLTGIFPVEGVSATNAEEYCVQLGKRENLPEGYRLPTEAEWEYACRAGTTTRFTKGDLDSDIDSEGWCTNNSSERTHRIAELAPNQFSLYDMHGNVCEWVLDNWEPDVYRNRSEQPVIDPLFQVMHSNRRIWRGGSSGSAPLYCRSSKRESNSPAKGYGNNGFRVVLTVDALKKALENEPQISSSLNYGLKFDGTVNGFSIPLPETDLTGNATLEAWITCPQSAREKNNHTVLEAIGPDLNNLSLFLNGRGYPTAYVYHNGAQAFQQIFPLVPTHLAAVIHENQIQLFVNGKLKASNELPPRNTVINSLHIAPLHHWREDPSPIFEGEIAEVRLSNVARYTADFIPVKRHETDEHTLLLYHCDEGQGNVLNDSSGNNRHGKVLNATWVQQRVNTDLQQSPAYANPSPSKAE